MAAPFIIPFNFQPASSPAIKTASYTVPSGKYANINDNFGDITIDSVKMSSIAHTYTSTLTSTGLSGTTFYYSLLSGCSYIEFETNFLSSSSSNLVKYIGVDYEGTTPQLIGGSYFNIRSGIGTGVQIVNKLNPNATGFGLNVAAVGTGLTYTYISRLMVSKSSNYWVGPGSVLNGSSYIVTEYNVIS